MEDKPKSKRGGANGKPKSQTAIPLKLDNDLLGWLNDYEAEKRNRFINVAVRERIERLQFRIKEVETIE